MDGRREAWGVGGGGGGCWNEIYCKWEKTPTRERRSQMETLLNQDKLLMGGQEFFFPFFFFLFFFSFSQKIEQDHSPSVRPSIHLEKERNTLAAARGGSAEDLQHTTK